MFRIAMICLALTVLVGGVSGQDISKLLQRVPANANVLTVIDAKALLKSPKAAAEGWSQKRNLDYQSGKTPFPPALDFAILASEYSSTQQSNLWQVSLLEFPGKVYEDKIAKREGSDVELIDNLYVIPTRRNMYFVQFARESYGLYSPADRQQMLRWMKFAKSNTNNVVNEYLTKAAMEGGAKGQITIAMDLNNTLDRAVILKRLQESKALADVDRTKWGNFIHGIRGMRLHFNVTNSFVTELQLDFNEDVEPYAKLLPGFVMETIDRGGYHIGDLSQWQTSTRGKSMVMKGNLDTDDFKKVMSHVLPATMGPDTEDDTLSGPALVAAKSQQYFKAMDNLLKELRAKSDLMDRDRAWQTNASWYEYTFKKIQDLPLVNIDPALSDYSAGVANQLLICSQSLRGVNIENKVLDSYKRKWNDGFGWGGGYGAGYGGGYAGFYGGGTSDNYQEVASAKAEQAARGAKERNAIWTQITENTGAIRGMLSQKYKLEF